jgi:YbbR domain-containing protein
MAIIKLSATESRRVSVFITCLVLAVLAWIITVLSNPYTYNVKGVLSFKNTPQKRAFHSLQPDTVTLKVNGNGWDMLFSKMNIENKPINVDLRTLESRDFIVLSNQLANINSSKEIKQEITGFFPDTLYFDFTNRKEKRVPIHLNLSAKFEHQYFQSNNIQLKPSYVVINGPSSVIDKINSWQTDTLKVDSVDETIVDQVGLQIPNEGNLNVYPKRISVTVPVDEFTEKSIYIPIKLINNAFGSVKIFPQKVKVTFNIALSKYDEIDEEYFEATANINLWKINGYKSLPIVINKIPSFCKVVKIEPANIDFIIKNNVKNWHNR